MTAFRLVTLFKDPATDPVKFRADIDAHLDQSFDPRRRPRHQHPDPLRAPLPGRSADLSDHHRGDAGGAGRWSRGRDRPGERATRLAARKGGGRFEPLVFGTAAARAYGAVAASVRRAGAKPAARAFDALIAATALANDLPLYTCNQRFRGIDGLTVARGRRALRCAGAGVGVVHAHLHRPPHRFPRLRWRRPVGRRPLSE